MRKASSGVLKTIIPPSSSVSSNEDSLSSLSSSINSVLPRNSPKIASGVNGSSIDTSLEWFQGTASRLRSIVVTSNSTQSAQTSDCWFPSASALGPPKLSSPVLVSHPPSVPVFSSSLGSASSSLFAPSSHRMPSMLVLGSSSTVSVPFLLLSPLPSSPSLYQFIDQRTWRHEGNVRLSRRIEQVMGHTQEFTWLDQVQFETSNLPSQQDSIFYKCPE